MGGCNQSEHSLFCCFHLHLCLHVPAAILLFLSYHVYYLSYYLHFLYSYLLFCIFFFVYLFFLQVGDIIEVTKMNSNGMWEGSLNGKSGLFPATYIEWVEEAETQAAQ